MKIFNFSTNSKSKQYKYFKIYIYISYPPTPSTLQLYGGYVCRDKWNNICTAFTYEICYQLDFFYKTAYFSSKVTNQDFPYGRSASLPFSSSRCRQSSSDRAYNLQRFWMLGARRSSIKSHFVHLNTTTPSVWAAFCNKLSSSHGTLDFITAAEAVAAMLSYPALIHTRNVITMNCMESHYYINWFSSQSIL